jgi:hypothetical protein
MNVSKAIHGLMVQGRVCVRLSARRQHAKPRQARGEGVDQVGDGRHHVLAVVEHEQNVPIGQPLGERVLVGVEAITQKRDVANMRSAASSCNNLAKHWPLLRQTIALSAAEIPRFGVLASSRTNGRC